MTTTTKEPCEETITVQLPAAFYAIAQEAVSLGMTSSAEAFIAESVRRRGREVRLARLDKMAEEAMNDPAFAADMRETMQAFASVDTEHWPASMEVDSTLPLAQEEQAA